MENRHHSLLHRVSNTQYPSTEISFIKSTQNFETDTDPPQKKSPVNSSNIE